MCLHNTILKLNNVIQQATVESNRLSLINGARVNHKYGYMSSSSAAAA